jgi:hypothetical protein
MNSNFQPDHPNKAAAQPITLHLPPDLVAALNRLSLQSGLPPEDLLIDALRRGLNVNPQPANRPETVSPETVSPEAVSPEAFQQLVERVAALERLPQKVKQLAGKSIAS